MNFHYHQNQSSLFKLILKENSVQSTHLAFTPLLNYQMKAIINVSSSREIYSPAKSLLSNSTFLKECEGLMRRYLEGLKKEDQKDCHFYPQAHVLNGLMDLLDWECLSKKICSLYPQRLGWSQWRIWS